MGPIVSKPTLQLLCQYLDAVRGGLFSEQTAFLLFLYVESMGPGNGFDYIHDLLDRHWGVGWDPQDLSQPHTDKVVPA